MVLLAQLSPCLLSSECLYSSCKTYKKSSLIYFLPLYSEFCQLYLHGQLAQKGISLEFWQFPHYGTHQFKLFKVRSLDWQSFFVISLFLTPSMILSLMRLSHKQSQKLHGFTRIFNSAMKLSTDSMGGLSLLSIAQTDAKIAYLRKGP